MRAVLDTNVVVSATLVRGRTEDRILRAWRRQAFELVLSVEILVEMGRVLLSPRIRRLRWMTDDEVVSLLELLATESLTVLGRLPVRVCRDPDDDKFLAAAIEGEAEYVVTGDRDLLAVRRYRSVHVMTGSSGSGKTAARRVKGRGWQVGGGLRCRRFTTRCVGMRRRNSEPVISCR